MSMPYADELSIRFNFAGLTEFRSTDGLAEPQAAGGGHSTTSLEQAQQARYAIQAVCRRDRRPSQFDIR
jgi:hypothetical protein